MNMEEDGERENGKEGRVQEIKMGTQSHLTWSHTIGSSEILKVKHYGLGPGSNRPDSLFFFSFLFFLNRRGERESVCEMARAVLGRASCILKSSPPKPEHVLSRIPRYSFSPVSHVGGHSLPNVPNPSSFRNLSHGSVRLVISEGKPKFETYQVDPPNKHKWLTKKRFKIQSKREKQERKAANKRDPRRLGIKKKRHKFANAPDQKIKYKLEKVLCFCLASSVFVFWITYPSHFSILYLLMGLDGGND